MGILGVNMLAGLENAGDDENLYEELLQIYCEDSTPVLQELKNGLQHTDLQLFITSVHGLKGSSYYIGAMEMGDLFKEMEFAGKNGEMELIEQKLPACLDTFEDLLGRVQAYLDDDAISLSDGEPDIILLKKMLTALEDMDTDTFDALLERAEQAAFNSVVREQISRLRTAYDDFDYELAGSILNEMMQ